MGIFKFSTNINCKNCLRTVTPYLDGEPKITRWDVDLTDPARILTVEAEGVTEREVTALLAKAGYKAQRLD